MERKQKVTGNEVCNYCIAASIVLVLFILWLALTYPFLGKALLQVEDAVIKEKAVVMGKSAFCGILDGLFSEKITVTVVFGISVFIIDLLLWKYQYNNRKESGWHKVTVHKNSSSKKEAKTESFPRHETIARKKKIPKSKGKYNWRMMFIGAFVMGIVGGGIAFAVGFAISFFLVIVSLGGLFFDMYSAVEILGGVAVASGVVIGAVYGGYVGVKSKAGNIGEFWKLVKKK